MLFRTIADSCYHNYACQPKALALSINHQQLTYQQLCQQASQLSQLIQGKKLKRIGVLATTSLSAYIGILASSWSAVTFVPLHPQWPKQRLQAVIDTADLDAVIIDQKQTDSHPIRQLNIELITKDQYQQLSPTIVEPLTTTSDDIIYILFTSGSTGQAKGITITQVNFAHFIQAMQSYYTITADDRVGQFTALSFDMSLFDIAMAWHTGASLHVVPDVQRLAPVQFIQKQKLTVWYSVPSIINFCDKLHLLSSNSMPSLRLSLFAGEALSVKQATSWAKAAPNSRIDNLYGPTEVTVTCLQQQFDLKADYFHDQVPMGRPNPGLFAALIDEQGEFLEQDSKGELLIAGPQLANGYLHNPQQTEKQFVEKKHPDYGLQRWYRTGDYCFQDQQGIFHYLGRIDHQCKIQGYRVELDEIEYHLARICQSTEVAVIAAPTPDQLGQRLIAFITNSEMNQIMVTKQLQKILPTYMLPERIIVLKELPRNVRGKLDRKQLMQWVMPSTDES